MGGMTWSFKMNMNNSQSGIQKEWSNESSRGRLEGDAALVSPHCPRCPAPVWLSGMGEGVAKNEQNG